MISFPNAKINLGLHILHKRPDGFHTIETCFYPIPWNDALEIIPAQQTIFSSSGNSIPGDANSNLCLKTYESIQKKYNIPPVHIHLHKNIPIGAGLGGGSADAAFTAKLLNDIFHLNMSAIELEDTVRNLGSDCAFFIQNKSIIAHEKGDRFTDPDIVDLSGFWIYLLYPGIHVSTKDAYDGVTPDPNRKPIAETLRLPIEMWKDQLINDFESSIFKKFPAIAEAKKQLYAHGAMYAAMSGSGSTVFGLFKTKPEPIVFYNTQTATCIAQL